MINNPLVSVVMAAYNSAEYLQEAVRSVLNQSYTNLELIITDDASTDNTLRIAEKLAESDNRISVYSIPHAGRPSVPRNHCIKNAKGDLVAFLDSDDIWVKDKLKEQVDIMISNPGTGFVYSVSVTFGEVNIFSPFYEVLPLFFRAAKKREDLLNIGNTIPLSSVLVDADILKKLNGFDEDPELKVEDYDLWLRLSEITEFKFIPKLHVYYRIHSSQFSSDWEAKKTRLKYLEMKRNIKLPHYKSRRTRGGIYLFIRNVIHFKVYMLMRLLNFTSKLKK
jgi:glycosyltransferase involved in cell wall biosynthesis